jgi:Single-stranded DNA-specific exonuclease
VSEKGTDVYLLDHHPPYEKYEEYQSPKFNIINDEKNCGAGLTYRYVREITGKDSDPFLKALVTVGLYADVADETEGGESILSGLAEEGVSSSSGRRLGGTVSLSNVTRWRQG